MELRQLRYFVQVVESGSLTQAAAVLKVVTSALSQQITRLESELSTRLLQRGPGGVRPTDAGLAFWRQAQLALRHADEAGRAARMARLAGHVSVGLATTTASVLGLPLIKAMSERYPDVRLHLVEGLSGHLASMLNARQLDLAVLFKVDAARRWCVLPLLREHLFLIGVPKLPGWPGQARPPLRQLGALPLVLPSPNHNLRGVVDAAFARAHCAPRVLAEIDGLALLMDVVAGGLAATIQPGAATVRARRGELVTLPLRDAAAQRPNFLVSLSDEELSPAALAARVVVRDVTRQLVQDGLWPGTTLHDS
jgi:LysR family tcuABC transcriptional regulator